MWTFRHKLGELLAKITGKQLQNDVKRPSVEDLRPNKHTAAPEQGIEKSPPKKQPVTHHPQSRPTKQNEAQSPVTLVSKAAQKGRPAYFFQIGFDFGTSTSKAVVRDINTDRAWVYTVPSATGISTFLIPSVVICHDGQFERHLDAEMLYPEGGLYHLKMAIEKIARDNVNDSLFEEYKKILGVTSQYDSRKIAKLACIYFLASAFSDIIRSIIKKFPGYGQNLDDQMAINMAIPVANISDHNTRHLFEKILNTAWMFAWQFDSTQKSLPIDELAQKVENYEADLRKQGKSERCQVYPEVSANVQAFVRSPASSPDMRTIYFFSDAGAGTVDQSVFTYAGREDRQLNYFSAGVFPRGSSQIEITACGETINENCLEYWRKEKEQGKNSPILNHAKMIIGEALKTDTEKTLRDTLACLPFGEGISPRSTLEKNIKFIFSGGGHTEFPYQNAVVSAYKNFLQTGQDPIVTSIAKPDDMDVPKGCEHWLNRLYVAYGLSFLHFELAENTFPSENRLSQPEASIVRPCSCRGFNKNCSKCFGTGVIQ